MVTPEAEKAFLMGVFDGNTDAVDAFMDLARISQTMDDLIDRDKPLTNADIASSYWRALTALPMNPFYVVHIELIQPVLLTVFADYLAATEMENYSDHDQNLAFVLRDNLTTIATLFAGILCGTDYALSVSTKIRQFFHDETLESYKGGLQ